MSGACQKPGSSTGSAGRSPMTVVSSVLRRMPSLR